MVAAWIEERRASHGKEFREYLADWILREQKQTQSTVDSCMLLLDDSYLLSLPLPPRVVLPAVPGPRNFRFLFRRQVASLLGWTERRNEGDYHGFSDSINKFVREIWWPDEGAEALHRPQVCNRPSNPQVLPPAADVLPSSGTAEGSRRCGVGVEKVPPVAADPPSLPSSRGEVRDDTTGMLHRKTGSNSGEMLGSTDGANAAFEQQVLVQSSSGFEGRIVRQRLELGAGGTVLLHQSVGGGCPMRALPRWRHMRKPLPQPL